LWAPRSRENGRGEEAPGSVFPDTQTSKRGKPDGVAKKKKKSLCLPRETTENRLRELYENGDWGIKKNKQLEEAGSKGRNPPQNSSEK